MSLWVHDATLCALPGTPKAGGGHPQRPTRVSRTVRLGHVRPIHLVKGLWAGGIVSKFERGHSPIHEMSLAGRRRFPFLWGQDCAVERAGATLALSAGPARFCQRFWPAPHLAHQLRPGSDPRQKKSASW